MPLWHQAVGVCINSKTLFRDNIFYQYLFFIKYDKATTAPLFTILELKFGLGVRGK